MIISLQRYVTYHPLSSSNLHTAVKPLSLGFDSDNSERRSIKIGKKVSFNLNVQAYEPIQSTHDVSESDKEDNKEETIPLSQLKSTIETTCSYPSGYRYQNCTDCYDEDDEIAYEESDLDDDEYDCGSDIDEERLDQRESCEYLSDATDGDLKSVGRDRGHYESSVLSPVENLAQWKAIKAKAAAPNYQRKENIPIQQESMMGTKTSLTLLPCDSAIKSNLSKPLLKEAAVDASLSNWLALSNSH